MSLQHINPNVKHDALLIFDVTDSNPNGDPDNAGKPRIDLETGQGLVSDVSLKRKIRDSILFQVEHELIPSQNNGIFVRHGISLNEQLEQAYGTLGQTLEKNKKTPAHHIAAAAEYMIEKYYDVRMFGAVMTTGIASAGKATGPVTVGIARSLHPVQPIDLAITRMASTKEEDRDNASQMGSKSVIPYGLYAARIHYQPTKNNQVTSDDLQLLWSTIATMFEVTRSAARPDVSVRSLAVFSHDNPLGNAPARTLLDLINIEKTVDRDVPESFSDYKLTFPSTEQLPSGVAFTRIV